MADSGKFITKSFEYPPSLGGTQVLLKSYDEIKNKIENSKEWVLHRIKR